MTKAAITKILAAGLILAALGGAYGAYLYFMPHREVASSKTDERISATALVDAFLKNAAAANTHYLSEDGNSLILEVTGTLLGTESDYEQNTILILGDSSQPTQVYAYLNTSADNLPVIGSTLTVKGAITAGAEADDVLGIYTPARLQDATIVSNP
jgi:hypothetical protein